MDVQTPQHFLMIMNVILFKSSRRNKNLLSYGSLILSHNVPLVVNYFYKKYGSE